MRNLKIHKKLISTFLSCIIPITCLNNGITVNSAKKADIYYPISTENSDIISYSQYYDKYINENRPQNPIFLKGTDYLYAKNGTFSTGSYGSDGNIRDNVLIWESAEGNLGYEINVAETGVYALGISYFPIESNSNKIELSMKIDGETPFATASRLVLNKSWVNEREIYTDSRGNQIRPSQIQKGMWLETVVGDCDGLFDSPLLFYLEKGTHEISFTSERGEFAVEYLKFFNPEELPSYADYVGSADISDNGNAKVIRIEAEDAIYKSDPSLCPSTDNSSYLTSPSDPVKVVYNTLGNNSWKKALQQVTWEISADEVGNGGWFRIGIKSKQDEMRGLCSNRRIYIDGQVPCKELDCVKFPYNTEWKNVVPKAENGEDIYVYLAGGQAHTITMECVVGEIGDALRKLETAVTELNGFYRKILMITGPSPDKYTDYYVHEKIDGLTTGFMRLSRQLKDAQAEIEALSGSKGSEAAALENMAVILDKCVEKPLKIPEYLSQIKNNTASISSWILEYRDQPLELDYIELATENGRFTSCKKKFGKSVSFGLKSFFGSFFEDYTTLSDETGEEAVEVWVALGRDQSQIIKEMTENEFIPEYNIPISINLVTGGIVEATLAGKGPDVGLFLGGEFPVNLASRGLLADISQFPEYNSTIAQFQKNALTHYQYDGGTYGLPISQSFPMMFYRTDILTELGYTSPPETWTELIDMLPAIQRNYMNVGLVLPPANISPATESGHTYAMLLLQKGQNYYNDALTQSTLDSTKSVQAFEEWTDFYTKYSFDQNYDAFSRFRTGEYPIVISNYTFANQLTTASPEITGLWDFCPVPGTVQADGKISHTANSTGSGAVIFKQVENQENAWQFIKWFTSAKVQAEFASRTEGLLGTLGRFDTANIQAFSQLSWSAEELRRLTAQQTELAEIPIIPSSYAVTRNIMNAFRETVNQRENPRDTLIWYNRDINDEIERKRENLRRYKK